MVLSAECGDVGIAMLLRFMPPQVFLRRANVATDCISDRIFETSSLRLPCLRRKRPRAVAFVPPQIQSQRANIATDCISDRAFASEASRPSKPARRPRGPPRRAARNGELRKRSFGHRLLGQLDFVPPQVGRRRANVATDCVSDRFFEASDLVDAPDECMMELDISRPPAKRRCNTASNTEPSSLMMHQCTQLCGSRGDGKLKKSFCASYSAANCTSGCDAIGNVLRVATLGCTLGIRAARSESPQADGEQLPVPRPRQAGEPSIELVPSTMIAPLGDEAATIVCQIDLSTNSDRTLAIPDAQVAQGDPSDLQRLADLAPEMGAVGSLDDLHSTRRQRRWPSQSRVCIACRPYLDPPRGKWLRFTVCPHRLAYLRKPLPPLQMRLLLPDMKKRKRRERGRWGYLDGRRKERCSHGMPRGRCPHCEPLCYHGRAKRSCKECRQCQHGKLKESCSICAGCRHGKARGSCLICSGCPHGRLRSGCVQCNACPHGHLRGNCPQCKACPHGRVRTWCAECNACEHGKARPNCGICNGCPHGLPWKLCEICMPCPHGLRKVHCVQCYGCEHGVLRSECRHCSGCPHQRVRRFCRECNPCPHGKRKQACKLCSACPHGRIANSCSECNGCPHGRVRRFCKLCNGCIHGKLRRFCKFCCDSKVKDRDGGNSTNNEVNGVLAS